jgi:hypothetical protein
MAEIYNSLVIETKRSNIPNIKAHSGHNSGHFNPSLILETNFSTIQLLRWIVSPSWS